MPFQKVVTSWMADEAYRRLRTEDGGGIRSTRPRLRRVEPAPEDRYVNCVPLVALKAAAGAFSDPQHVDDADFEWVAVDTERRLRPGMFVAQVVGRSMEPSIEDGSYCLFAAPATGTRQRRTVLVQLRDARDPETGHRYTVKRYESDTARLENSASHTRITLISTNPEFAPIVLENVDEAAVRVIAELVEVLGRDAPA
ncbi:S24 family peptidase [Myxococcota bacterium]|nr:S24 family peptidase [Myxococcota bacterium]